MFEHHFNPLVPGLGTVGSPAGGLVAIKSIREPSGFVRRGDFKGREVDRCQTLVLRWIDRWFVPRTELKDLASTERMARD